MYFINIDCGEDECKETDIVTTTIDTMSNVHLLHSFFGNTQLSLMNILTILKSFREEKYSELLITPSMKTSLISLENIIEYALQECYSTRTQCINFDFFPAVIDDADDFDDDFD